MKATIFSVILLFLISITSIAQNQKKSIPATRISGNIRIDGIMDEEEWNLAPVATDFIEYIPYSGKPALFRTEVRILYDNSGLYIGAMMFDPAPDSIPMQLGLRDADNLNADYFQLEISPFHDGINAFNFKLYSSDVQADYKSPNSFFIDYSWDAVWHSKAKMNDKGWVAEIKIPFSAIRFSKENVQEWGINFARDIRRFREMSTWNYIDQKIEGTVNQEGWLTNITQVKPPLRLSISPYVSGYIERNPENKDWQFSYNYGADLKYGITQSFTLDMTLIPDFGQVPSDDKIYNFSPFEIRYDEKRQFFTEGTELFNKGGIFYSRRIGAQPVDYYNIGVDSNEYITENPMQTKLLNATKISGRTNNGLGIGFFNAISGNTWATVRDSVTGVDRRILTQGTTNYNMIVFDQALKNNSFFDLLNTNYYIPGSGYCANVSGTQFKFAEKNYTYALFGDAFICQKYYSHSSPELGYRYNLSAGKISGNFLFKVAELLETETYDPNDMGYNDRNNKFNNSVSFAYNIYKPFGKFLSWTNGIEFAYNCLYEDFKYTSFRIYGESHLTTLKHFDAGLQFEFYPVPYHDYYEARVPGYMYIQPAEYSGSIWISTDYRKRIALDASFALYSANKNLSSGIGVHLSPRFRLSNRLFFIYQFFYEEVKNNIGYVLDSIDNAGNEVILFGQRDILTITNILQGNFMFSSKMSVDLRVRHYWTRAPYSEYYTLQNDGTLAPSDYNGDQDVNFNQFNIDLSYIWNFAPGSQLSVVWKNAITTYNNISDQDFFDNLHTTLTSPASNSFSVRILYYLDALYFKKKKKV